MPDPAKLYAYLADAWDQNTDSDQYRLMSAIEAGFTDLRAETTNWINEQTLTGATGDGLTRRAESRGIVRPPGMNDTTLRALSVAMLGARRGTRAYIKTVIEAASGITVDVNDKQTDGTIPSWEIQVSPNGSSVWPSYGRGVYVGITTETLRSGPFRSALAGPVLDALGFYGALRNDHAWFPVDMWTLILMDKIRPAGTYYHFIGV